MKITKIKFFDFMVPDIKTGTKTATRRFMAQQPLLRGSMWELGGAAWSNSNIDIIPVPGHSLYDLSPAGNPGDIIYVEEEDLYLLITKTRLQQLQNITGAEAIAEGCIKYGPFSEYKGAPHPSGGGTRFRAYANPIDAFINVWSHVYGEGWDSSKWVWVYDFRLISDSEKKELNAI